MDLSIPYTFYPIALLHGIAWILFLAAVAGGVLIGVMRGRRHGRLAGLASAAVGVAGLLAASMVVAMILTFFVHDL